MNPDPRILSQLAHFDGQVHNHRAAIDSGRVRESHLEQLRLEYAGETQEKKSKFQELENANKALQKEIDELMRQVKQHSARLNDVQDTREYNALNDEVRYLLRQVENKEETILANMEMIEKSEAEWKDASGDLDAKAEEIRAEIEKIRSERAAHEQEMGDAKKALAQYLEQVDPRTVTWYERRAKRQNQPVVWADKDACGWCHAKLTPQEQLEVKSGRALVICQQCARVIVASLNQDTTVS